MVAPVGQDFEWCRAEIGRQNAQIQGLGQILQAALDRMVELYNLSVAENDQRAAMFKVREKTIGRLGQLVTGVRRIVSGHFVAPALSRLGLEGQTARESIAFAAAVQTDL